SRRGRAAHLRAIWLFRYMLLRGPATRTPSSHATCVARAYAFCPSATIETLRWVIQELRPVADNSLCVWSCPRNHRLQSNKELLLEHDLGLPPFPAPELLVAQ